MAADELSASGRPWRVVLRKPWLVVALVALVVLLCGGGGWFVVRKAVEGMDPNPQHMTKEQAVAFEAQYRDKDTLQQEAQSLEALLARTSDELVKLVPGLTWSWNREWGYPGCPGDPAADTRVNQIWVRDVQFSGPIPDAVWPQAVEIVRRAAASYSATEFRNFMDQPDYRDVNFSSPGGARIGFSTAVAAVLIGVTPCRLPESYFTEHNIPIPGTR